MPYNRDPRVGKLPLWVQGEFDHLERKVRELEDALERATTTPEDSNVTLDPYSEYSRALPRNPHVRFHIGEGRGYFEAQFDGHKLKVRGVSDSAFDDFLIIPALANEIAVEFRRPRLPGK